MIKFPSIEQFRNTIREVKINHDFQGMDEMEQPIYQHLTPYPTLTFKGTVKLHGTNAAVVKYKDKVEFQSRERVLSLQQDNAQFMLNMMGKNVDWMWEGFEFEDHMAVFGEWCGGNIQAGVGVCEVPKMFVIFACKIDGQWVDFWRDDPSQGIYNIHNFKTWEKEIDFEKPELIQNELGELTLEVEKECPVAKEFGISGIGEGIVWSTPDRRYVFKVKGEKHSASKVKTLASVDVEMVESINNFVDNVLTESRLKQGLDKLQEMGLEVSQKSTGNFLSWIVNDVHKEEEDTIVANQLDPKKINSILSNKARMWFFNNI